MGQKVHPRGFRLGINETWDSRWFAGRGKDYGQRLVEDMAIRKLLLKELAGGGVARLVIERFGGKISVKIHTARPGIVIGKKGSNIDELVKKLKKVTTAAKQDIKVDIEEIHYPELDAHLLAQNVAGQLERRMPFRRVLKQSIAGAMKAGAQGVKIQVGGRLAGAEIARSEWLREGRVPLHTLRARIDYGTAECATKYGRIGVKVWLFLGEDLPEHNRAPEAPGAKPAAPAAE